MQINTVQRLLSLVLVLVSLFLVISVLSAPLPSKTHVGDPPSYQGVSNPPWKKRLGNNAKSSSVKNPPWKRLAKKQTKNPPW
ncbi:unnamed protein product [Sympodiomycopsis kandeliae]